MDHEPPLAMLALGCSLVELVTWWRVVLVVHRGV
jgi:hypothetical protein